MKSIYKTMPKPRQKDNQKTVSHDGWHRWISREDGPGGQYHVKRKYVCLSCHHSQKLSSDFSFKTTRCSKCGSENIGYVSPIARVPRKTASKKVWENFINHFVN